MRAHLGGARYLYSLTTGRRTDAYIKAEVKDVVCMECHSPERIYEGEQRGNEARHRLHLNRNIRCDRVRPKNVG